MSPSGTITRDKEKLLVQTPITTQLKPLENPAALLRSDDDHLIGFWDDGGDDGWWMDPASLSHRGIGGSGLVDLGLLELG